MLDPTVGVTSSTNIVKDYILDQNYPNPFNNVTNIRYQIPRKSFVSIRVYDISGKEVGLILNENKSAGSYLVRFNAKELSSGIYFYKLQAVPDNKQSGSYIDVRKMILVK